MARKLQISPEQRFAVWLTHNSYCYWCGEPLEFRDTTVDHVIPEHYEQKPAELAELVAYYGLVSFAINDFANWVPAHQRCNRSKGLTLFPRSPAMLATLVDVATKVPVAVKNYEKVKRDQFKGKLLGRLDVAVAAGTVTKDELLALFEGTEAAPVPVPGAPAPNAPALFRSRELDLPFLLARLAPGWTVVERSFGVVTVTDGKRAGVTTTAETPDASWCCPHCQRYGPWNGVICMSCNRISDPAD